MSRSSRMVRLAGVIRVGCMIGTSVVARSRSRDVLPGRRTALSVVPAAMAATLAVLSPTSLHAAGEGIPASTSKPAARPITFVVPFSAGSATDLLARALAPSVGEQAGQSVIVDNRPGASGMIAAQQVARSAPDGYTVLIATNTTQAANQHLFRRLAYDPVGDFSPVTGLGKGGQVLVVAAASPYRTTADLLRAARAAPGRLTFGSGSASSRVAGEMFKQLSGTDIVHVPYKSNPPAVTDVMGGQVDMMITDMTTGMPQIQSGKLRALGYSTPRRSRLLPDTPTIAESGVPGYDMSYWFAAYVRAGTPPDVVGRLHDWLAAAARSPAAQEFFRASDSEAFITTPDELARFQADETVKWGKIIRAAGIEPE